MKLAGLQARVLSQNLWHPKFDSPPLLSIATEEIKSFSSKVG
jgi:hypothetical protein